MLDGGPLMPAGTRAGTGVSLFKRTRQACNKGGFKRTSVLEDLKTFSSKRESNNTSARSRFNILLKKMQKLPRKMWALSLELTLPPFSLE